MKFEVLEVVDPTQRITAPRGGKNPRLVDSYPVPTGGYLRIRINLTKNRRPLCLSLPHPGT
jgi:hypothetical protein